MKRLLVDLFRALPKAELHVHLEGTLEPELALKCARRNQINLPFPTADALHAAYRFNNLQSFLNLYYQLTAVLCTEEDFYELFANYLQRAHLDGIVHVEPFIDPQAHLSRGIKFETFMRGFERAQDEALRKFGITSALITCFLRDKPLNQAYDTLEQSLHFQNQIIGVGLASAERGHPARNFKNIFAQARSYGFHTVAHAGEEDGPDSIYQALEDLLAERIDHGIHCLEDKNLVQTLVEYEIPLTVCPTSNVALKVVPTLTSHPIMELLKHDIIVTLNSDDPAYFGAYLGEVAEELIASKQEITADILTRLCQNSIHASFLPSEIKLKHIRTIHQIYEQWLEDEVAPAFASQGN